jgi:L-ascorbate metabolism protein UlaG (beta-lactamase superfamily)
VWNIEGLSILHIGALNRDLSDKELQELEKNNIDILFLPVGGNGLDVQKALHLLTTIEPRIVIPIHFALPGLKEKLSGVEQFTKEMGVDASNVQNKVIIKANKLPQEELTTILLKP